MSENLKKIIDLCDCEPLRSWLKKNLEIHVCDYYIFKQRLVQDIQGLGDVLENTIPCPINFNPETGNWQIIELLRELHEQMKMKQIEVNEYSEIYSRLAEIKDICLGKYAGGSVA